MSDLWYLIHYTPHIWEIQEIWEFLGTDWDLQEIKIKSGLIENEKQMIIDILNKYKYQKDAAKELGISERCLCYKIKKYKLKATNEN